MQRGSMIKAFKVTHRYLGLFFAPAVLFFAFSGALQVFGWHETGRGSNYVPARWIVEIAQLHKKQTLSIPAPKVKEQAVDSKEDRSSVAKKDNKKRGSNFALKCFVFVMSIALMMTTVLGMVMAFQYGGDRRVACVVILFGCLFPVAVVLL